MIEVLYTAMSTSGLFMLLAGLLIVVVIAIAMEEEE